MGRRVKVKQIEKVEAKTCKTCKHAVMGKTKMLCLKRMLLTEENRVCGAYEHAEAVALLSPATRETLVKEYAKLNIELKSLQEALNTLKEFLADVTEDAEIVGEYKIVNKEIERRVIDSAKAKELIQTLPDSHRYFKTIKQRMFRLIPRKDYDHY